MAWLQVFPDGDIFEMDGAIALELHNVGDNIQALRVVLARTRAGTFKVAPPDKPKPTLAPPAKSDLQAGIDLIKEFEGCELEAYPDPGTGGTPITIGYGATYKKDGSAWHLGDRITQQEAEEMLEYMVNNDFLPSLEMIPTWREMNSNQQGAILSFSWNCGAGFYNGDGFGSISRALSDRQYWGNVPTALMLYVNPGTNVEAGLRRRRKAEGDLWNQAWIGG